MQPRLWKHSFEAVLVKNRCLFGDTYRTLQYTNW